MAKTISNEFGHNNASVSINKTSGSNEAYNNPSNNISSISFSSLQLKKNKIPSRSRIRMYSVMEKIGSKTNLNEFASNIHLSKTITGVNPHHKMFMLILVISFCFGVTLASKECQGNSIIHFFPLFNMYYKNHWHIFLYIKLLIFPYKYFRCIRKT